jgi:hypothetical protein
LLGGIEMTDPTKKIYNSIQEGLLDVARLGVKNYEKMKMTEQEELIKDYQEEIEKCFQLAQRLDALNPELAGAFTGTPSERIERQLYTLGILK